ncbi:MAG: DNA polymerase III subunit delta [Flavobacteriales bacterium]
MDHLRIIRDIEMRNFKPIYFLMGEEPYFIDQIVEKIENSVLDEASKAFGQTIVYGRDVALDQVVSLAKGFPMMGDLQVVIVKEAQDLKELKRGAKSDDDDDDDAPSDPSKNPLASFEAYVANPSPTTLLVFAMKNKKLDKRLKLYKSLEKIGVIFDSEKIKDYKMAEWIKSYAKAAGFGMDDKVSELLSEYLGNDLSKVVNEISKLAIILPKGTHITAHHIEENIGISKDFNVWELQKSLGTKDVLKANRIIHYFENNPKSNPIQMVLPSLYNYFCKLAIYIALDDKSKAASAMGVSPYAINDYKDASKKYDARKVERIIGYLRQADRQSKGGDGTRLDVGDIYRELIYKTLH